MLQHRATQGIPQAIVVNVDDHGEELRADARRLRQRHDPLHVQLHFGLLLVVAVNGVCGWLGAAREGLNEDPADAKAGLVLHGQGEAGVKRRELPRDEWALLRKAVGEDPARGHDRVGPGVVGAGHVDGLDPRGLRVRRAPVEAKARATDVQPRVLEQGVADRVLPGPVHGLVHEEGHEVLRGQLPGEDPNEVVRLCGGEAEGALPLVSSPLQRQVFGCHVIPEKLLSRHGFLVAQGAAEPRTPAVRVQVPGTLQDAESMESAGVAQGGHARPQTAA
mmetsp:Transcript_41803/g.130125  ORF Transcript_41803/g.130125 Transcript_41803/m.130125 type:complete len:277 (+) Transcript_41803:711-1541(+)